MNKSAFSFLLLLLVPLVTFLAGGAGASQRPTIGLAVMRAFQLRAGGHPLRATEAVKPLVAPPSGQPGTVGPQVGLDSYSIQPEHGFGFAGNGFQPNEWVEVYLGTLGDVPSSMPGTLLTRASTNAGGNLAGRAVVPMLPPGDYPLSFFGWHHQDRVVMSLNIQKLSPWVVLDNYSPPPHTLLGFRGQGFASGEPVLVYLNQQDQKPIIQVKADKDGQFNAEHAWELPDLTGTNSLIFVGTYTGAVVTVNFTVLSPQPSPAPLRGVALSSSFMSAQGFLATQEQGQSPLRGISTDKQGVATGFLALDDPVTIGMLFLAGWLVLCLVLVLLLLIPHPDREAHKKRRLKRYAQRTYVKIRSLAPFHAGPPALKGRSPAPVAPMQSLDLPFRPARFCPWCGLKQSSGSACCVGCGHKLPGIPAGSDAPAQRSAYSNEPLQQASSLPALNKPLAQQSVKESVLSARPGVPLPPVRGEDITVISRGERPLLGMQASARTDRGRKRAEQENEDSFLVVQGTRREQGQFQPFGLFVVSDGMGGHANGQKASRMTIEVIFRYLAPILIQDDFPGRDLLPLLEEAIQSANQVLYRLNQQEYANIGATVTAALVVGHEVHVCNVGDSRTYLLSPQSSLHRITIDHSIVESLVVADIIRREDVYTHPRRSQIYRILGQKEWVQIDTFRQPVAACDRLLLCSDGLWEMVRDPDLEAILRGGQGADQTGDTLIRLANEKGGPDNITALVVKLFDIPWSAKQPGIETIDSSSSDLLRPSSFRFLLRSQ